MLSLTPQCMASHLTAFFFFYFFSFLLTALKVRFIFFPWEDIKILGHQPPAREEVWAHQMLLAQRLPCLSTLVVPHLNGLFYCSAKMSNNFKESFPDSGEGNKITTKGSLKIFLSSLLWVVELFFFLFKHFAQSRSITQAWSGIVQMMSLGSAPKQGWGLCSFCDLTLWSASLICTC